MRLIIELVAHHGNLSVPDLRSLSLACKESSPIVQEELAKRRLTFSETYEDDVSITYTYYIASGEDLPKKGRRVYHGWYTNIKTDDTWSDDEDSAREEGIDKIITKTRYQDGKREGMETVVSQNGKECDTYNYIDGKLDGEVRSVYNEQVDELSYYKNGNHHGLQRAWHRGEYRCISSEIIFDSLYKGSYGGSFERINYNSFSGKSVYNDEMELSRRTKWHPNGRLAQRETLGGPRTEWWDNGQLKKECTIIEGREEGPHVECYETGQIKVKCGYSNGKLHGRFVSYRSNGSVKTDAMFDEGIQVKFSTRTGKRK